METGGKTGEFGSRNSDLDVTAAAEFSWPASAVAATLITPTLHLPRFSDLYGDYVIQTQSRLIQI